MIRFPKPLKPGNKIALTAFSSGVDAHLEPRLDRIIQDFKNKGFEIIEGNCLRGNTKHVSAPKEVRAMEFMDFLLDDNIDAVVPPWGGELALEILPLLDFMQIKKAKPKWIFGYSDVSTLTTVITSLCDWATAHTAGFMEQIATQSDELTQNTLGYLATDTEQHFCQASSQLFQKNHPDWSKDPFLNFALTEETSWKPLNFDHYKTRFSGRLFGGCVDTLLHLFGSPFMDFEGFKERYADNGSIFYFENAELSPMGLERALLGLSYKGVFDDLNGLLIGRNSGPEDPKKQLDYKEALIQGLGELNYPVLYDVDIGHKPPNLTLINGALAEVAYLHNKATITQWIM